jgi:hypothetical protein
MFKGRCHSSTRSAMHAPISLQMRKQREISQQELSFLTPTQTAIVLQGEREPSIELFCHNRRCVVPSYYPVWVSCMLFVRLSHTHEGGWAAVAVQKEMFQFFDSHNLTTQAYSEFSLALKHQLQVRLCADPVLTQFYCLFCRGELSAPQATCDKKVVRSESKRL